MARSPKDLALLLDVQANHFDNKSYHFIRVRVFRILLTQPRMKGIKIGWLGDWGGTLTFEDELLDLAHNALNEMSSLGAIIHDLKAPFAMNDIWTSWCDLRAWQITNGLRDIYEDIEKRKIFKA